MSTEDKTKLAPFERSVYDKVVAAGAAGTTSGRVGRALGSSTQQVVNYLNNLEQRGFVKRNRDVYPMAWVAVEEEAVVVAAKVTEPAKQRKTPELNDAMQMAKRLNDGPPKRERSKKAPVEDVLMKKPATKKRVKRATGK
jgi:hypothetical protein